MTLSQVRLEQMVLLFWLGVAMEAIEVVLRVVRLELFVFAVFLGLLLLVVLLVLPPVQTPIVRS